MAGRIYTASQLPSSREISVDCAVIGSGAGGAVTAAVLAEGGKSVAILEEGSLSTRRDFTMREADAYRRLYQERGNRATQDLSIVVLQGRGVGGGTTVNWTTSFRTPEHVLRHWEDAHGVSGFSARDLRPSFEAVEERLGIHQVDPSEVNRNNQLLLDGAKRLGLVPELLRRNTRGCMQTGYCGMGCPTNAKQAMHLTYLPDAVAAGADLYANTRVTRLLPEGRSIVSLQAVVMDEARYLPGQSSLTVRAKRVIVSAGAVNSPALLLRSGLKDSSGLVGRRTFLHPVTVVLGFHDREVRGDSGVPQTVSVRQGLDRPTESRMGFFIETPPIHPLVAALGIPGFGDRHAELMRRMSHASAMIGLMIDGFDPAEPCGTVRVLDSGRAVLDYAFSDRFWRTARQSTKMLAEVTLAAGARQVWTTHERPILVESRKDLSKIDAASFGPLRQTLMSAHQMGGCQMGGDPTSSVVSPELRHWDYDNLFVIDGSVLPTAAGVNPAETIYGIAHLAANRILSQN
jgi:choline dehydrogenase-like flavoprotein